MVLSCKNKRNTTPPPPHKTKHVYNENNNNNASVNSTTFVDHAQLEFFQVSKGTLNLNKMSHAVRSCNNVSIYSISYNQ